MIEEWDGTWPPPSSWSASDVCEWMIDHQGSMEARIAELEILVKKLSKHWHPVTVPSYQPPPPPIVGGPAF